MLDIIPALQEDAELITQIKTAAYDDENERFGPKEDISAFWGPQWYADLEENKRLIDQFHVYKIQADEETIGTFWLHEEGQDSIALEDFCIQPSYQNRGYGYQILMEMEQLFPEKKKWNLGTPYYSVRNHHLYEKAGYVKVGVSETDLLICMKSS